MLNWLKLSHYRHSGSLRPHEHTSYLLLGIILVIAILPLTAFTAYAESPGPQLESISLTGTMPGVPPTIAATIDYPIEQQHITSSPAAVSGTCPKDTLVEIFKSDIFAGSTACKSNGQYTIDVDLLMGKNVLIARVYDSLNQVGPDSNIVNVYYDLLPMQSDPLKTLNFGGEQLIINSDSVFRGVFPDQVLSVPINVIGGTAPYAFNIEWGDSNNTIISRDNNIGFSSDHTYSRAGTYQISIQVSDSEGRVAFLTIAAIVNGQPSVGTVGSASTSQTNMLLVMWPLYVGSVAVVASFWIGEQREKHILFKRGLLLNQ